MKKYPSQIRYEKGHPVVSFRLSRDLKERLKNVLEGKSFADFVKEGLGVREREKKSLVNARNEGFEAGYGRGKLAYGVRARCAICGLPMTATALGLREALGRYIERPGWGHEECMKEVERRRR